MFFYFMDLFKNTKDKLLHSSLSLHDVLPYLVKCVHKKSQLYNGWVNLERC